MSQVIENCLACLPEGSGRNHGVRSEFDGATCLNEVAQRASGLGVGRQGGGAGSLQARGIELGAQTDDLIV